MLISERSVLNIVYWPMSNHLLPILLNSDGKISVFGIRFQRGVTLDTYVTFWRPEVLRS